MKDSRLNTSIEFIKGIGSIRSKILKGELGLKNCYDLLSFFPYKYLDRSRFYKIKEIDSSNIYFQHVNKMNLLERQCDFDYANPIHILTDNKSASE